MIGLASGHKLYTVSQERIKKQYFIFLFEQNEVTKLI